MWLVRATVAPVRALSADLRHCKLPTCATAATDPRHVADKTKRNAVNSRNSPDHKQLLVAKAIVVRKSLGPKRPFAKFSHTHYPKEAFGGVIGFDFQNTYFCKDNVTYRI